MIDYINQEVKKDEVVVVALPRYEELIITEQKYKLIIEAALTGAELTSWTKEVTINGDATDAAIKALEPGKVLCIKNALMKQQKELVEENCMEVKA